MRHFFQSAFCFVFFFFVTNTLFAQSLSGVWEGSCTYFTSTCCDWVKYDIRMSIFEDSRGALWIETEVNPEQNNEQIAQLFTAGIKMPSDKMYLRDTELTFGSPRYINTCSYNCRIDLRNYLVSYKKQGNKEILTGLINSQYFISGGEIELTKTSNLPHGDKVRLIKFGQSVKWDPNVLHSKNRYGLYIENELPIIYIGFAKIPINTKKPNDIISRKDELELKNVTVRLVESGGLGIVAFDIVDKTNGKTLHNYNPFNLPKKELMDLEVNPYGVMFPNKEEWAFLIDLYKKESAIRQAEKLRNTPIDTIERSPIKTINGRTVEIKGKAIQVNKKDKITIEIWSNVNDNDIITLYLNDQALLKNHTLTNNKETIEVKNLKDGDNVVVMFAENLGNNPPNIAVCNVYINGKLSIKTIFESDMKKNEAIKFIVKE